MTHFSIVRVLPSTVRAVVVVPEFNVSYHTYKGGMSHRYFGSSSENACSFIAAYIRKPSIRTENKRWYIV